MLQLINKIKRKFKVNSSHSKKCCNLLTYYSSSLCYQKVPLFFCSFLIISYIKAISVRNVQRENSSANHWLMGRACGLWAGPQRNDFLAFFRINDRVERENANFIRLGSVFGRAIHRKAVIWHRIQDGYPSSTPHVEGKLFPLNDWGYHAQFNTPCRRWTIFIN